MMKYPSLVGLLIAAVVIYLPIILVLIFSRRPCSKAVAIGGLAAVVLPGGGCRISAVGSGSFSHRPRVWTLFVDLEIPCPKNVTKMIRCRKNWKKRTNFTKQEERRLLASRRTVFHSQCATKEGPQIGRRHAPLLRMAGKRLHSPAMKFALAILVYLLIALILGWGILLLVAGKPWLLIVGSLGFIVAFDQNRLQVTLTRCGYFFGTGNLCCINARICDWLKVVVPIVPANTPAALAEETEVPCTA